MKRAVGNVKNIPSLWALIIWVLGAGIQAQEEITFHPLGEWRTVTSKFGYRNNPFSRVRDWQFHKGIDIDSEIGDPVYAWREGFVIFTGSNRLSGRMVNLQHADGFVSKYHHLEEIHVREGDFVEAGEVIAAAGATGQVTGSHLHFTLMQHGDHVDPLPFIPLRSGHDVDVAGFAYPGPVIYKTLQFNSIPTQAEIYVDGEHMGITPLRLKLAYGEHFVELDYGDGYEPFMERIWIDENFSTLYNARLSVNAEETPPIPEPAESGVPIVLTDRAGISAALTVPAAIDEAFASAAHFTIGASLGVTLPMRLRLPGFLSTAARIEFMAVHGEFEKNEEIDELAGILEPEVLAAERLNDFQVLAGTVTWHVMPRLSSRLRLAAGVGVSAGQLRVRTVEEITFVQVGDSLSSQGSGRSRTHKELFLAPQVSAGVRIATSPGMVLAIDAYRTFLATDTNWMGIRAGFLWQLW